MESVAFQKTVLKILLKIRATSWPESAEVTANSNTPLFSTKPTTIKMAGPTLVSTIYHYHAPQSFTNIAGS